MGASEIPESRFDPDETLVFNATGAVGDLYVTVITLRLPAGTLFYDSDVRHSDVFRPSVSE